MPSRRTPRSIARAAKRGDGAHHVIHDVVERGPVWAGPRGQAARVGADQSGPGGGGDLGQAGIRTGPGVVDQVGPGRHGLRSDLGPPGVDRDHDVGKPLPNGRDGRERPAHLLPGIDLDPWAGLDPADIDDLRPVGDRRFHRTEGGVLGERGTAVEERVGRAVHDRHDHKLVRRERPLAQAERAACRVPGVCCFSTLARETTPRFLGCPVRLHADSVPRSAS